MPITERITSTRCCSANDATTPPEVGPEEIGPLDREVEGRVLAFIPDATSPSGSGGVGCRRDGRGATLALLFPGGL